MHLRWLSVIAFTALSSLPAIAQAGVGPALRRPPSPPVKSWFSQAAVKSNVPLLYASGIAAINIYAPFGNEQLPVGQIGADGGVNTPAGLATDAQGNVWVANAGGENGATNEVFEFARGATKHMFDIHQKYGVQPEALAVGNDGTVYVADFEFSGIYYVTEFAKGATKPFLTLGPFYDTIGVAVDANNNLYVDYYNPNDGTAHVEEFAPHATTGVDLLSFPGFGGGLQINSAGDVVIVNVETRAILTYPIGQKKPSKTIYEPGLDPFVLALGPDGYNIFVSAGGGFCCGKSDIFEIQYATGKVVQNITAGFPYSYPASGLTLTPAPPL